MKKYNKKQRHEIYKKALKFISSPTLHNKCLCHALTGVLDNRFFSRSHNSLCNDVSSPFFGTNTNANSTDSFAISISNLLPEFILFKPDYDSPYWFNSLKEREIVLHLLIEMTR